MRRTIVIGDLHGCLREAEELLEKCNARPEDRVIFLGDLIDRGVDSAGCVDLAMRIEARQGEQACILGNHEEKILFYRDVEEKKGHVNVTIPTHIATRQQLKAHHYEYLRQLPLFIRLPEHNAVCVHAGVYPGRSIEQQDVRHLLHAQMIQPYDKHGNLTHNMKSTWSSKVPHDEFGWRFWTEFWDGPERIIFGHSVLNKPLITDKVVGLDGGGCFGLELWALVLPENKIVSVKCTKQGESRDRRGSSDRKLYLVHDDVGTY